MWLILTRVSISGSAKQVSEDRMYHLGRSTASIMVMLPGMDRNRWETTITANSVELYAETKFVPWHQKKGYIDYYVILCYLFKLTAWPYVPAARHAPQGFSRPR